MLFLVPLALSLATTGYGVYQGVKVRNQVERDGKEQLATQAELNEATELAEDASYRRALVAANQAATQAREQDLRNAQLYSSVLYAVATSLVILTIWMIVQRPRRANPKPH